MFEEIIGWPYVSPGTNDRRGIDCSGAWVRIYKLFGLKIDHGSNSQYRRFCGAKGVIAGAGDLRVGMAVFKLREWKANQNGHRDYGTAPGDLYHVGCVTSTGPLRIVHATPPMAKADTAIGNWKYWGMLKEVDYGTASPSIATKPGVGQARVITTTSGLRLRKLPDKNSAVIKEMPIGTIVQVLAVQALWVRVLYVDARGMSHRGWCRTEENGIRYIEFGREECP